MRKLSIAILLLFLPLKVFCQELPQPSGWVNDFAGVISLESREKINALISELEVKTSAEIFVVTISSIAPYDEKEYARRIFDSWKPGKKGKDNGVLLLLAIQERRWRIETGYGLEGILPDGVCGEIGRNYMVPYFKKGNYDAGIYSGVSQVISLIAKNAGVGISNTTLMKPSRKNVSNTAFLPFFALLFFSLWNIPWPIFIGLPFTLLFASAMAQDSKTAGILAIVGYFIAMFFRHRIWSNMPVSQRKSFFWILIWGLAGLSGSGRGYYGGGGGFGGGGFGGGGFGGGGGGCGGGGGGGGGF